MRLQHHRSGETDGLARCGAVDRLQDSGQGRTRIVRLLRCAHPGPIGQSNKSRPLNSWCCPRDLARAKPEIDECPIGLHPVPRFEHKAAGAIFAVLANFTFLQHTKGLRGVVGALYVGGVEDVAQLVAGQAVARA